MEDILTEAVNAGESSFPQTGVAELDDFISILDTAPLDDDRWNRLFDKYRNGGVKKPEYFYIKASKPIERSDRTLIGETDKEGYIFYDSDINKMSTVGNKARSFTTIDPNRLNIAQNRADATIFTAKEVDDIVSAIKSNKDLKASKIKFFKEKTPAEANIELSDPARALFRFYFNRLSDNRINYISQAEPNLYQICRTLRHPLSGNSFLRVFSDASKNDALNHFRVTPAVVRIFNNLIVDGYTSSAKLRNPADFKTVLLYNKNLANMPYASIKDLLKQYDAANELADSGKILIPAIKEWDRRRSQLAKNLVLIDGDEDALGSAIRRNDVSPSLVDNLPSFGDTLKGMNAEAILEWTLRNPDSLGELLQLMRDPSANKSDIQVYLINAKETVDPISQEGDTSDAFEATFRARNFAKDSTVKFTIARSSVGDKANLVGLNLEEAFTRFTQNSSQNVLAIKDARTLEVKEDFRGSVKVAVRKNDSGRWEMTRFNLSFDEAEEEEDIVDIEVEEEPAKPEAASTNNLQVGGKTFDEILSLNRDEYREFLKTLSDNDKRFVGTLRNLANRG